MSTTIIHLLIPLLSILISVLICRKYPKWWLPFLVVPLSYGLLLVLALVIFQDNLSWETALLSLLTLKNFADILWLLLGGSILASAVGVISVIFTNRVWLAVLIALGSYYAVALIQLLLRGGLFSDFYYYTVYSLETFLIVFFTLLFSSIVKASRKIDREEQHSQRTGGDLY